MTKRLAGSLLAIVLSGAPLLSADAFPGRFFRFERLAPRTETVSLVGISSICQDEAGFLWFGTSDGLARYDGYRFVFFRPPADGSVSPAALSILPVTPARSGDLWIGTNGQGLLAFSKDTQTITRLLDTARSSAGLSFDIVLAVQEDFRGDLWIGTRSKGLIHFDRETRTFAPVPLDPEPEVIWDVLVDSAGSVWIGTLDAGLFRIDPATGEKVHFRFRPDDARSLGSDTVWTLFEDGAGAVWAGTKGGGLDRFDARDGGFTRFFGAGDFPADLSAYTITAVAEDRAGRLWLGTSGDGLRIWDRRTDEYTVCRHDPQDPESLGDDGITSIFEDNGGVIWVGTVRGGVNKCLAGRAKFEHYKHNNSNPRSIGRDNVQALWEDGAGTLWLGSRPGLERVDRQRGASQALAGSILSIQGDRRGSLWLGTESEGLIRFDPATGRQTRFVFSPGRTDGPLSNRINALLEDASDPDVLWIGTLRGVNRLDTRTGRWARFVRDPLAADSLVNPVVTALYDDGAGALWVGTLGGLSRLAKTTGRCVNAVNRPDGLPGTSISNNTVNCLHGGRDGTLWVGTDVGLDRFDRATGFWRNFALKDGLAGEVVCGILEDGAGRLWLSTNRGLSRFDPTTERFTNFGLHDGLQGRVFNPRAAAKGADGRMFFGGGNGINVFRPDELTMDPVAPPVVWTAFYRNNVEIELPAPLASRRDLLLNYKMGLITFEFAALCFTAPELNSFAYKLEPGEADWIPLVPDHSVSFYDLGAGRYTLRVKAANPDGTWNEEGLAIALTVLPPFWKTWWFLPIVALFLVSGAALAASAWKRIKSAPRALGEGLEEALGAYGLTDREKEVLRLVLRGARNKDIEKALFISASTVRNHISNIFRKLGVRSRLELINRIGRDTR
jgi:ligand-binding sensor domain-containing protein/DNA-binding CsgD family transcriptional regulator